MKISRLLLPISVVVLMTGVARPVIADDGGSPLLSAPKISISAGQPDLQVGTRLGGKFKGADIYSSRSSSKQRLTRKATSKMITSLYRVQNDSRNLPGPTHSIINVSGSGSDRNFEVTYFTDKGKNVTSTVLGGRYVLNIARDSEVILRQRIAPARSAIPSGSRGLFAMKAINNRGDLSDTAETEVTKR